MPFPLVCLLVSGGHTAVVLMRGHGEFERLGETRDDAAGEAFDKVAWVLGLGYPAGGYSTSWRHPGTAAMCRCLAHPARKGYEFSFSGLKTAVMQYVRKHPETSREDVCAGFQAAVVDVLVAKTVRGTGDGGQDGGDGGRRRVQLRAPCKLRDACRSAKIPLFYPSPLMCTDNAAMIAAPAPGACAREGVRPRT